MSTTPLSSANNFFAGESTFSAQLNNVVSRSVARASLPITELQNQQSTLTSQQSEVQSLGSNFMAIQSAIDQLNTASGSGSTAASIDNTSVATPQVSTGALMGTYNLNVTSIGSQTNAMSAQGSSAVTDPSSQNISSATSFTLTVDGSNYTISPSTSSLNSLVQAINTSGANVQATVVNVGGSSNPDYRLSVQSTQYAPDTIQLSDGTNNLLSTLNTGSYVTYKVNGQPSTAVNSSSRNISLSTGLTASVNQTGSANITVSQNTASIATALSSFASAYNSASAELTKNRGQNGGALAGDSLVGSLQSSLNSLGQYSAPSPGVVSSLSDLGLTFDSNGQLSFDQATFASANSSSLSNVLSFLGSETGGGFIQSAYSNLTSLTSSTSGVITQAGNNIGASITSLTSQISAKQSQVSQLQTTLTTQMASADAAISSLQGQLSEITNLFAAELQQSRNFTG